MAKKSKKVASKKAKAPKKVTAKKTARTPSRRVTLGLPTKAPKIIEATGGDAEAHPAPSAETSKTAAAEGCIVRKDGNDVVYVVTARREFSKEECAAILNVSGEDSSDNSNIGDVLLDFLHKHIDDAVAEAEADTASEKPRYLGSQQEE